MKNVIGVLFAFFLFAATGCAPAILGAGAAGAYSMGTDKRSVGSIWSDANINNTVKNALVEDPNLNAWKIDVDTLERVVTLTGQVESITEMDRAVEITRKIPGVKSVNNFLQIGSKTVGETVDDTIIGAKIRAVLTGEPGIRSLNVDVDVNKGVVILLGIVETGKQRYRIEEIARNTKGTVEVINKLKAMKP